jgi:hypothetical protein
MFAGLASGEGFVGVGCLLVPCDASPRCCLGLFCNFFETFNLKIDTIYRNCISVGVVCWILVNFFRRCKGCLVLLWNFVDLLLSSRLVWKRLAQACRVGVSLTPKISGPFW